MSYYGDAYGYSDLGDEYTDIVEEYGPMVKAIAEQYTDPPSSKRCWTLVLRTPKSSSVLYLPLFKSPSRQGCVFSRLGKRLRSLRFKSRKRLILRFAPIGLLVRSES